MVKNHLGCLVDIGHHTEDESWFLLQSVHPSVHILGIIIEDALVKAHRIADHGSGQFRNEFFLGVLRITEMAFHVSAKAFLYACRMGHLMSNRAVVLHAILIDFFWSIVNLKLGLHRDGNLILRRTIGCTGALNVLDLADPGLLVNHRIELL